MKPFFAALCALILGSCGDGGGGGTVTVINPVTPPPPTSGWIFQNSPGMTAPAAFGSGGFSFGFPQANGVHYLIKGYSGALSQMSMTYVISAAEGVLFPAVNDCSPQPQSGSGVTFYFQVVNDNGLNEFGRWYGRASRKQLVAGPVTMTALLEPAGWSSVFGKNGDTTPDAFAAAKANVATVGVSFGNCFYGHGAYATGVASMEASEFVAQ